MTSTLISVMDDDSAVCASLADLLRSAGYEAATFASAEAFLASDAVTRSRCIVADIQMSGMTGLDLIGELDARGLSAPVIIVTARSEDRWPKQAKKRGAAAFLLKPFGAADILACVE